MQPTCGLSFDDALGHQALGFPGSQANPLIAGTIDTPLSHCEIVILFDRIMRAHGPYQDAFRQRWSNEIQ
jgi:hypothetical protein